MPTTRTCPFDPPPELSELRQNAPIAPMAYPDGHVGWLVTSHALARRVLADPRFSSRSDLHHLPVPGLQLPPPRPGAFMLADPPTHTRYRRLLTGQFTVRRMNLLTPRIEQITNDVLAQMQQAGPPADLVESFALPIPSLVICELLGVPYADRGRFQQATRTMFTLHATPEQVLAARQEISGFLAGLVHAKRTRPADDLLSDLVNGDGALTDDELVTMALTLLVAGHETTANMLALGTFALLSHPEQLAALRAQPSLIDSAVEELLRYLTILHLGTVRTALEDAEIGGVTVKAGQTVTISLPAANRDPEAYDNPDTLDLSRRATGHVAFGHGIHQCLGQQLARIEMRIGYQALFDRLPGLRLAADPQDIPIRADMSIYGVHRLPVTW
ncbi:cytochrome P450 [Nonomuraea jabiensis]|uniref:cytochrome P450 n=1 Tax=Nonomuraea jabiensis TaxID=882448 RepID=UPI003D748C09